MTTRYSLAFLWESSARACGFRRVARGSVLRARRAAAGAGQRGAAATVALSAARALSRPRGLYVALRSNARTRPVL